MTLTPRQLQIAELVARGYSDKRIAREKGISVETVKRHVQAASSRIGGWGKPRYRLLVWFFDVWAES